MINKCSIKNSLTSVPAMPTFAATWELLDPVKDEDLKKPLPKKMPGSAKNDQPATGGKPVMSPYDSARPTRIEEINHPKDDSKHKGRQPPKLCVGAPELRSGPQGRGDSVKPATGGSSASSSKDGSQPQAASSATGDSLF